MFLHDSTHNEHLSVLLSRSFELLLATPLHAVEHKFKFLYKARIQIFASLAPKQKTPKTAFFDTLTLIQYPM